MPHTHTDEDILQTIRKKEEIIESAISEHDRNERQKLESLQRTNEEKRSTLMTHTRAEHRRKLQEEYKRLEMENATNLQQYESALASAYERDLETSERSEGDLF